MADEAFKEKIASLQFAGRGAVRKPRVIIDREADTKSIPIPDDVGSRPIGGYQIEHGDGRVDARVHPQTVRLQVSRSTGKGGPA